MLEYFTSLSITAFIVHVLVWMSLFAIAFGLLLANRPGWRDEIRAISILIAVLSIIYFSLEQRNNQISRVTEESIEELIDLALVRAREFDSEIAVFCHLTPEAVNALGRENREIIVKNQYCDELIRRSEFIVKLVARRTVEAGGVDFTVLLNRPEYNPINEDIERRISDTNDTLISEYTSVREKIADDEGSKVLVSFFYIFVALFAAGAGIDVGSELRKWFRRFRKRQQPAETVGEEKTAPNPLPQSGEEASSVQKS